MQDLVVVSRGCRPSWVTFEDYIDDPAPAPWAYVIVSRTPELVAAIERRDWNTVDRLVGDAPVHGVSR